MIGTRGWGRFSGRSSFSAAVGYATRSREDDEPALAVWSEGVTSMETAALEMAAVAGQSRDAGERLYHLIISWGPEERPSFEQARNALRHVGSRLGFDGLQVVAGLQNDGRSGMWHLHAIYNLVDPETLRVRSTWRDFPTIRQACREWEQRDGWRDLSHLAEPGSVGDDRYGMRKRFSQYVRREVAPDFGRFLESGRQSWNTVTSWLGERGIRYEVVREYGARLVGRMSGWIASVKDLGYSHRDLVQRLGVWDRDKERNARTDAVRERLAHVRADVLKLRPNATQGDLHAIFERHNLELRRHFNGVRVVDSDGPGWLRIARNDEMLSLRRIEERFGHLEPSQRAQQRQQEKRAIEHLEDLVRGQRLIANPQPFLESLFAARSVVDEAKLKSALERDVPDEQQRAAVAAAVAERLVVVDREDGSTGFTTPGIVSEEEAVRTAVASLAASRRVAAASVVARTVTDRRAAPALGEREQTAVAHAVSDDRRIALVSGVEMSRKAAVIETIAQTLTRRGYAVRAIAMTAGAVEVLRAETGVAARSVGEEIAEWGRAHEPPISSRDVLIIDDGEAVGTQAGRVLVEEVARSGASLIVLADDRGFEPVGRGSLVRVAQECVNGFSLEDERRHKAAWQAAASGMVRDGKVVAALDAYREHGYIHDEPDDEATRRAAVLQWARLEHGGTEAEVKTDSPRERRALNVLVRAAHRALGRLPEADVHLETIDGKTPYCAGDRVVMREAVPESGLRDGSLATVRRIVGSSLHLQRADGMIVAVDTREHPGVQHAYVTAGDPSSQPGASGRRAVVQIYTRELSARNVALGMLRHGGEYHGFFSRSSFRRGYEGVRDLAQRNPAKELVRDTVERGRGRSAVERVLHRETAERGERERV